MIENPRINVLMVAMGWLTAFALALALDGWLAGALVPAAKVIRHSELAHELREFGHFGFTIFFACFAGMLHQSNWRGAVMVILSASITGVANPLIKWGVGRVRPVVDVTPFSFEPFRHGWAGLFNGSNLCFPSGHAALAFATASALAYLAPKGKWGFYAVASAVALERVGENAHYLSDVVGGAFLGIVATWCAVYVMKPVTNATRTQPSLMLQPA